VIEIGPAVEDDDWCTLSDFSGIQLSASDRDAAFSRRAGLSALQPSRRTGRRSCCVCARKDRKDQRRFHGGEAYNTLRQTFVLIGTTPRVTGNSAVKPLGKGCRHYRPISAHSRASAYGYCFVEWPAHGGRGQISNELRFLLLHFPHRL